MQEHRKAHSSYSTLALPVRPAVRAHSASSGTSNTAARPVSASSRLLLQRIGKQLGCELSGVMALLQQQQQQQQQCDSHCDEQQQQQQQQQCNSSGSDRVNAGFNVLKLARTASQLLQAQEAKQQQQQQQRQQQELSQQVQVDKLEIFELNKSSDVQVADVAYSTAHKKPLTR
jgi:hypothetical protein